MPFKGTQAIWKQNLWHMLHERVVLLQRHNETLLVGVMRTCFITNLGIFNREQMK